MSPQHSEGVFGMIQPGGPEFDTAAYLAHAGLGRRIVQLEPKQAFFSQGDPADFIFYLQNGRAKITVVSQAGKEATIAILAPGDFLGEESLTATPGAAIGYGHGHHGLHSAED